MDDSSNHLPDDEKIQFLVTTFCSTSELDKRVNPAGRKIFLKILTDCGLKDDIF